jgi:hypothetical protein
MFKNEQATASAIVVRACESQRRRCGATVYRFDQRAGPMMHQLLACFGNATKLGGPDNLRGEGGSYYTQAASSARWRTELHAMDLPMPTNKTLDRAFELAG